MAKQVVIAAMEETFGEYILNMSKENLKIAAVRGKIKLENVQLDGDMIGSMVLSAVGLQAYNFGILSCSVQQVHINVPWNKLEQEPTVLKLKGVNLVCVPLVPLTANQIYGAGTPQDPVCTLRTRMKRLSLARMERDFWNGQMRDEGGPPLKRIQRAVEEVRRDLKQKRQQQQQNGQMTNEDSSSAPTASTSSGWGTPGQSRCSNDNDDDADEDDWMFLHADGELPDLPRDWKVKFREKMMRNMEASMHNVHVRVEVEENGLDFSNSGPVNVQSTSQRRQSNQSNAASNANNRSDNHHKDYANENGGTDNAATASTNQSIPLEERAFCFGFTLESFVVRTANEEWEAGRHDTENPVDGSQMSSVKGHLGPNEYVVKNNKIGYFDKLSFYWDQEPPILLSESSLMRGGDVKNSKTNGKSKRSFRLSRGSPQKLVPDKWHARIAEAMQMLFYEQEPGEMVRQSLGAPAPAGPFDDYSSNGKTKKRTAFPHVYVCKDLNAEVRSRTSDRMEPGPISCSADVMPFSWDFSLRPHQYKQYTLLRVAIQRQQRFDTMLRQRPTESPKQNPRAWWQYAICCVTARPNSRPWKDVLVLCRNRNRYIDLIKKKNSHRISGDQVVGGSVMAGPNGFHGTLTTSESSELLQLEELLPLEALRAFHLRALLQVYESRKKAPIPSPTTPKGGQQRGEEKKSRGFKRRFARFRRKSEQRRRESRGSGSEFTGSECSNEGAVRNLDALLSTPQRHWRQEQVADGAPPMPQLLLDADQSSSGEESNQPDSRHFSAFSVDSSRRPSISSDVTNNATPSMTLTQAMTMRMGNKVWFIDWRFHDASMNVGMIVDNFQVASLTMCSSGNIRSFGKGKRDIVFDINQCDIVHRNQRILYVKSEDSGFGDKDDDNSSGADDGSFSTTFDSPNNSKNELDLCLSGHVPTIQSLQQERTDKHGVHSVPGKPDLELASSFLDLPPPGVACRIVAGMHLSTRKISVAAHPATFLWTSSFLDGLGAFQKTNPDIGEQMRNAATPLARKAQMALLSPGSRGIHLNIMAPKIWFPILVEKHPQSYDQHQPHAGGTLILDAGAVRLKGEKEEGDTDFALSFRSSNFQANFHRNNTYNHPSSIIGCGSDVGSEFFMWSGQGTETSVIKPFSVSIDAKTCAESSLESEDLSKKLGASFRLQETNAPQRQTRVHVSPICLNLVDAEVLARALGRLYARSLSRVSKGRQLSSGNENATSRALNGGNDTGNVRNDDEVFALLGDRTQHLAVKVDKVELALEGHSKRKWDPDCDKSMASLDSLHESSPSIRAYLVQVDSIAVNRISHGPMAATRLEADDAFILRFENTHAANFSSSRSNIMGSNSGKGRREANALGSQYRILVRGNKSDNDGTQQPILRAALLHDGKNHLDEVEVDIDSVVLRVTTTTLKDCTKAFKRIAEVTQVATREMERKVHEEGRRARRREGRDSTHFAGQGALSDFQAAFPVDRPPSPTYSMLTETSGFDKPTLHASPKAPSDSSILFRVTLNESTLLAGRPTGAILGAKLQRDDRTTSFAVIQVLSSALVMFQSIENPDGTGSKTLHVSIDNASSLVNTEFERVSPAQASPMIGPTGAEFRVVYSTESLGCVVSQDVSLDCEGVKICVTPNDFAIMCNISKSMIDRLKEISSPGQNDSASEKDNKIPMSESNARPLSSIVRYQKRGTGIATSIRIEVHAVSFVLLKAYKSHLGSPEFLDFCLSELKGRYEGCISALSGETTAQFSINFYNSDSTDWEYSMEPVELIVEVDQMPNELILQCSAKSMIQINLTGLLLQELADMKFDFNQDRRTGDKNIHDDGLGLKASALSTVGLRRATEAPSVKVHNLTGFDVHVVPDSTAFSVESGLVPNGQIVAVEALPTTNQQTAGQTELSFSMRVSTTACEELGDRAIIYDLIVRPSGNQEPRLYLLPSIAPISAAINGRVSPDTVLTEESAANMEMAFLAEPVVEYCMHNQRISSLVSDVYSTPKGCDILSGGVWTPSDEDTADFEGIPGVSSSLGVAQSPASPRSPSREGSKQKGYWIKPYQSDSPEWTDMTCTLRMALERVMLPDSNWMWANDWTVDLTGGLGESTDADGWEYQTDFESFTRNRRDYRRGDSCRRRRWTRTRMVKPPQLDDPHRLLRFVWAPTTDEHGNVHVEVRSNLRIFNSTDGSLSFFLFSPSWTSDVSIGVAEPGGKINVPVALASAVYMRIGRAAIGCELMPEDDSGCSDRIMILPLSPNSSNYIRTSMDLADVSGTVLHFLVEIRSRRGIVDVVVEPVLRIINLLPCQVECQVGEVLDGTDKRPPDAKPAVGRTGRPITKTETLTMESGGEGKFTAINPWRKPHVSFRVPGYKWSIWQRIINRRRSTETWRPSEAEEDWHFASKGDTDFADEFKSVVHFERWTKSGDSLLLIMSFECGHSPTVRLYSQYWILDRTGFSCNFAEGFEDILGSVPDRDTSRKSYLKKEDLVDTMIQKDMKIPGSQWSIGAKGMSLYFSKKERLAFSIEDEKRSSESPSAPARKSRWSSPLDISNVMPKTMIAVEENGGTKCYEFSISVNVCPGIYSRTRLIRLVPRYRIINLLHRELIVAQDGALESPILIPSQSSVPFHWEKGALPRKVRLGTPNPGELRVKSNSWTNGRVRLDSVGISSMRIPNDTNLTKIPMVVQTEVRLATKEQPSAVVAVIWSAHEKMNNPLYTLRNNTPYTILCRQPLQEDQGDSGTEGESQAGPLLPEPCNGNNVPEFQCSQPDIGPMILSFLGLDRLEEFVWILGRGEVVTFGFDDPEKPHILEWTCVNGESPEFDERCPKAFLEVDAMGSVSTLSVAGGKQIKCHIGAEHSTKVIEFTESSQHQLVPSGENILNSIRSRGMHYQEMLKSEGVEVEQTAPLDDEEDAGFGLRINLPRVNVSVVDNSNQHHHGREILMAEFDRLFVSFSQTREGYHEFELRLSSFQVDNHVPQSIHPVLIFCPPLHGEEPLLHVSAVRRLQNHSNTFVFRYAAIRLLEIDIFLDRRTAESIANFIEPIAIPRETQQEEPAVWAHDLTNEMAKAFELSYFVPEGVESTLQNANTGRIYFEQLHLHPVRLSFTFTQEWIEFDQGADSMMTLQFVRGMASVANAPLTFNSFVVSHVFEAPQAFARVIATHYSSQLTKQIFAILGSLAILTAPADFISNVGTGVRDFFYEPINGAVHGPRQFIEGLEAGTQSLARGVFVGVVRGAANVTELVNANLVGLTADEEFIDERKAHQRLLTDALSRGNATRTFGDSLHLAGASVARSFKSGALGILEQPAMYASKHGPVGFLQGVGKALVGAVVKPVVGVGDAAALIMNHMSDATSTKRVLPKIPKRLRRALPNHSSQKLNCVRLSPYDERAAKAQKIVTGGESLDDVYYGHLQIPSHLIIASQQCLWAIDRRSREPWCANWEEVSHFSRVEGGVRVVVFSKAGLKSYTFYVDNKDDASKLYDLLSMHADKMGNSSELSSTLSSTKPENLSRHAIPGMKGRQVNHIFGSCNIDHNGQESLAKDEIDLVEQCFARVKRMGSESTTFFKNLDEEAWNLVTTWGQLFTGLSSKRCLVAGVINGTGGPIQIKSTKLMEGGSPCYTIPTKEFDPVQGILHAGGCILFFGWGVAPNLNQNGNVFMSLETNGFVSNLATFKNRDTFAEAMPGYQVGFLEKSVDDSGWWAKYWLIVKRQS